MATMETTIGIAPLHNITALYLSHSVSQCVAVGSLSLPQRSPLHGLSNGAGGEGCEGGAPGVEEGVVAPSIPVA